MKLLIDGDIIAYKAASAAEKPINWGNGLWTLHAWENDVTQIIDEFIAKLKVASGIEEYEVALSSAANFRKEINPSYKANRSGTRKPMLLSFARDYVMTEHNGIILYNLEADDILGIYATKPNSEYVIWSEDKDLRTIFGHHLIGTEIEFISRYTAEYKFYVQVLTGDATDNYSGCPKIGEVTAEKILKKATKEEVPLWDAIVAAYEKEGLLEEYALTQARMAYILHYKDYNQENGEITLWTP